MSTLGQIFTSQYGSEPKSALRRHLERPAVKAQRLALERCLLNEFYGAAKLLVASTSIVNARAAARPLQTIASAAAFMAPQPVIFAAVAAGTGAKFDRPELMVSLQEFYGRLSFARALQLSALQDGGLPQPCRSSYASSSMSGSEYARPPTLFVTNSTISKTALFNQGAISSSQSTK